MHFLAELSLRRGAVVVLAAVAILLGGVFVATRLKTELIPDVDFPVLTVVTTYPGAGPEDVAEQISKPIEQAISGVPRLESLQSTSAENLSFLVAQFQFGTNMKEVEATINDNLKVVTLPPAASTPKAARINLQAMPIVQLSLSGDKDVAELEKIARERIVPEIQSIDGVYSVDLAGGAKKQVSIALDPQKMRDNGVSVQQVAGVVQANNMAIPSGSTTVNGQAIIVRTLHQFTSLEELENLAVGASGSRPTNLADQPQSGPTQQPSAAPPSDTDTVASGSILDLTSPPSPSAVATDSTQIATQPPPVASTVPTDSASPATPATPPSPTPLLLKDIATVTVGSSQDSGLVRTNGQPGVGLAVAKTEDGNTVKVANAVTDKLEAIKKELPEGLTLTIISDQSTFIEESIDSLLREGALGAIFAVIVIFVFLLSVRSTLVSAVSIPLSVMAALLLLQWQGLTINIMTLGGLTIAIGRVVDDAIVVLENIHRHARQGEDIARAVRSGTKEVASAITSSTLTTICVFLPLGLVGGLVGQFFLPFALTVTFALLASLVVALTVVPVLAKYLVGTKPGQATERDTWVQRLYTPVLTWSLRHRVVTLAVTAVVFLGSFGLLPFIPTTFLPSMQEKTLTIDLSLPPGADNAASLVRVEDVERILGNMPDVDVYQATMGGAGGDLAMLSSALSGRGTGGATF
ncbi:MAG: efflux RND transporter permease subunit, partial [Chloroflexi bacterium]|nr:efflux RND transporter permease subunit [Chloroflexota bacterium]